MIRSLKATIRGQEKRTYGAEKSNDTGPRRATTRGRKEQRYGAQESDDTGQESNDTGERQYEAQESNDTGSRRATIQGPGERRYETNKSDNNNAPRQTDNAGQRKMTILDPVKATIRGREKRQ